MLKGNKGVILNNMSMNLSKPRHVQQKSRHWGFNYVCKIYKACIYW